MRWDSGGQGWGVREGQQGCSGTHREVPGAKVTVASQQSAFSQGFSGERKPKGSGVGRLVSYPSSAPGRLHSLALCLNARSAPVQQPPHQPPCFLLPSPNAFSGAIFPNCTPVVPLSVNPSSGPCCLQDKDRL